MKMMKLIKWSVQTFIGFWAFYGFLRWLVDKIM